MRVSLCLLADMEMARVWSGDEEGAATLLTERRAVRMTGASLLAIAAVVD